MRILCLESNTFFLWEKYNCSRGSMHAFCFFLVFFFLFSFCWSIYCASPLGSFCSLADATCSSSHWSEVQSDGHTVISKMSLCGKGTRHQIEWTPNLCLVLCGQHLCNRHERSRVFSSSSHTSPGPTCCRVKKYVSVCVCVCVCIMCTNP